MNNAETQIDELVIFSNRKATRSPIRLGACVARCLSGLDELHAAALTPVAFIIRSTDPAYSGELVRQLRRHPDHACALIFVDGAIAPEDTRLADGPVPDNAVALDQRLAQMKQRQRSMVHNDSQSADALLLRYMWLRPGFLLEPVADWRHPRGYHYPLLEALDRSDADAEVWLDKLDRSQLLEKVELKDRQRECDHCGSAHLRFIDVCPNCRSIDIRQQTALHCFTCGLIAPEERFVQGDQRLCPKCGAALRHIGTDYDRPLETSVCAACDHVFVEGTVLARCMVCHHATPPPSLRQRRVYSWQLAGAGRLAMQQGFIPATAATPVEDESAGFTANLTLMLKISRSQRDRRFALFGLRLINRGELEAALGVGNTARLVSAFIERLRESLDDADLMSRRDDDTVLFLLAHSDRKRIARLRGAIRSLTALARQQGAPGPDWDAVEMPLGSSANAGSAETLIARLQKALQPGQATHAA